MSRDIQRWIQVGWLFDRTGLGGKKTKKREGKYGGIWNESDFGPFSAQRSMETKKKVFPDQGEWGKEGEQTCP